MKTRKFTVLLYVLLALCLLAACARTEPAPAAETPVEAPAEPEAVSEPAVEPEPEPAPEPEPEPAPEPLTLSGEYVVTYQPSDGGYYQLAAETLAEALGGAAVVSAGEETGEQVITIASDETLGARNYAFAVDGACVAITGGTEYAAYQAVNRFIETYAVGGEVLPGDLAETVTYTPDLTLGTLDEKRAALADIHGRVMISAHRGAHMDYPDNTIPAVEEAVKMGADLIEVDIQRTKDGQLILCHDNFLSMYTDSLSYIGTEGYPDSDMITDWTLEQLSVLKVNGTDYTIPRLEDIFPLVRGKALLLLDKVIGSDDLSMAQEIYDIAFRCEAVDCLMYQHASRFTMPDSFFDAIYAQTGIPTAHHIYSGDISYMVAFTDGFTEKEAQIQSLQVSFTSNEAYTYPDYILPMAANTRVFANTLDGWLPLEADNITSWQTLCDAGFSMLQTNDPVNAIAFARGYTRPEALDNAA